MLTRLKVNGFKNLIDIDLHFGPFTCIAGGNGVGKSNIFDAIQFLSLIADKTLVEAAGLIRAKSDSPNEKGSSIQSIFHRVGDQIDTRISFEVEMIIPNEGTDELGQKAEATFTFLSYCLDLILDEGGKKEGRGANIRIEREELRPISKGEAHKYLMFDHAPRWRNSVVTGRRTVPFISTTEENGEILINLHQDGGSSGKPRPFLAKNLPKTVLSTARYASETPTIVLARQEMLAWRMMHLEPSSLRMPDELDKFSAQVRISSDGGHLAATVYRLSQFNQKGEYAPDNAVFTQIANLLSELIPDVVEVSVDKDEKRQLLTLQVLTKDGTVLPAKSLSDGTLRFLALAVMDLDYLGTGAICLEEPENGIYPDRIPAIIDLLRSIPLDPLEEHGIENPLRQVIVNTHSPKVFFEVPDDSLVYVDSESRVEGGKRFKVLRISALSDTWRVEKAKNPVVSKGKLMAYFNVGMVDSDWLVRNPKESKGSHKTRRVADRSDISEIRNQLTLDFK